MVRCSRVVVAAGWLAVAIAGVPRHRKPAASVVRGVRVGRRVTAAVAAVGALAAVATVAAIRMMPGLVDVGFLGWMAWPLPVRLGFRLPAAVAVLAGALAALLATGTVRRWWTPRIRPRDAALTLALAALAAQLAAWHLIA